MNNGSRIGSVERLQEHLPAVHVLVVVPTYNEREHVTTLLARLGSLTPAVDLLVVDDGSPDGTADAFVAAAATLPHRLYVARRGGKAGLGTAYVDGFSWALAHLPFYQTVVQMDADLSHDPQDVPTLAALAHQSGACIGSRYVPGGAIPDWSRRRRWLSRMANHYARIVLRCFFPSYAVRDSTSGFVAWRRDVLLRILERPVPGEGYGFQISMKSLAHQQGVTLTEHPITFRDRQWGASKLSRAIVLEALGIVWWLGWQSKFRRPKTPKESSQTGSDSV
jgi:dolichol-phosphate mannosyltransferase